MSVAVETSFGELLDKISILEIKRARARAPEALRNIRAELRALESARDRAIGDGPTIRPLCAALKATNLRLWDVEDALRECEAQREFGPGFVSLAREVYRLNDKRAALKRALNDRLGSAIVEEKLYRAY